MAQQGFVFLRRLVQRLHVFERNHEHMSRRLRIDVLDHDAAIVLMDKLARNVTSDDFAEEAVVIGHTLV